MAFLSSLGTGAITNGVFFVADEACGFGPARSFAMGLLLGVAYIAGALGVGPALRRLAARSGAVSTRRVLLALCLLMGVVALVPQAASVLGAGRGGVEWTLWLVVIVYAPTSGAFWPLVESYVSGGRSGAELRRAVGRFSTVWSSALVVAFLAMGPLLATSPLSVLTGFGVLQAACCVIVLTLGDEPGAHLPERHEPHPPVYVSLLRTCRLLLPTSYFIIAVWSPYAPTVMGRLEVPVVWGAPLAATWMLVRVLVFALMERWHGWHGRWGAVVVGVVCLLAGIALALTAPMLGRSAGIPTLVLGLAVLGVGNGVVYASALYYVMEVGRGGVDAAGTHEGLIGVGFMAGPATGLAAVGLVSVGAIGPEHLDLAVLLALGLVLLGIFGIVAWRVCWVGVHQRP